MSKVNLTLNNDDFFKIYGRKKHVCFSTLGCKVNQYESEIMSELFKESGYEIVGSDEDADVFVINTCTVTGRSASKSRQEIRKAKIKNPDAIVAAVGCLPQTSLEEILNMDDADIIIGTNKKGEIVKTVEQFLEKGKKVNIVEDIMKQKTYEIFPVYSQTDRTRSYIKIQDGCNQFCTYCIIPFARGPIRSRSINDIINEVKFLSKKGYKEIVLTGIHVASYGKDLGNVSLIDVIKVIHDIEGIERIRLSSIEPMYLTEDVIRELSNLEKVCRHFHISLQSGCDATLKRMGRKYNTYEYKNIINNLRKYIKDVAITTDIMVGFPGETIEEFKQTYEFAKEICFSKIHVFRYSKRIGTKAAKFSNQVTNKEKEQRSNELIELSLLCEKEFIDKQINKTMKVLFEQQVKNMDGYVEGLTDNYLRVAVKGNISELHNKILPVKLEYSKNELIIGKIEGI
ncbi:MAG: tRNA (N(6)-L-threonylcarbamoyladenosine(37)-C(2))-methylthiotransferase MtaB [Thermoanaerobacteraceae bacterium]